MRHLFMYRIKVLLIYLVIDIRFLLYFNEKIYNTTCVRSYIFNDWILGVEMQLSFKFSKWKWSKEFSYEKMSMGWVRDHIKVLGNKCKYVTFIYITGF